MKKALLAASLIFSAGALPAREAPEGVTAAAKNPAQTFDETFNEQLAEVKAGGVIELRLPENPATGFSWSVDKLDQRFFKVVFDDFDMEAGTRTLKIKCLKEGGKDLVLEYKKSWETNTPPGKIFRLKLNII